MIIRDGVVLIVHYKPYYLGMLSNNILIKMILKSLFIKKFNNFSLNGW